MNQLLTKPTPKKPASKAWNVALVAIVLAIFGFIGLIKATQWYESHTLHFQFPIMARVSAPIQVWERKPEVIVNTIMPATPEQVDTDIKKYACEKWGQFECLTMIATFQAESGWNNEAWGYNTNKTLDYGIGQINSVNWKLEGCALKDLVDPKGNIDCAYKIWDRADGKEGDGKGSFSPWVAWSTNKYLAHLEK